MSTYKSLEELFLLFSSKSEAEEPKEISSYLAAAACSVFMT